MEINSTSIINLPEEILLKIASFVSPDLGSWNKSQQICKLFYQIFNDQVIFNAFPPFIKPMVIKKVCKDNGTWPALKKFIQNSADIQMAFKDAIGFGKIDFVKNFLEYKEINFKKIINYCSKHPNYKHYHEIAELLKQDERVQAYLIQHPDANQFLDL
jgi:hypothetical protein